MKLRNYFLLSIVVGAAVACSSNEDIPEEHVFTPNATLSLATGVYGDGRTKAVGIDVTEEEKKENKIHTLDVLVFSGTLSGAFGIEENLQQNGIIYPCPRYSG